MKRCSRCKRLLPEEEFFKDRSSKDGLQGYCKECRKEYSRQWFEENKEYREEYNRKYYQKNEKYRERVKEHSKRWYQEHKRYCQERQKEYYQKNKKHMREYRRRRYHTPDGRAAKLKECYRRKRSLSFIPLYPIGTPCLITGSKDFHYHHYTDKYVIPIDRNLHLSVGGSDRQLHRKRIKELLGPKLVKEIEDRIRRMEG